MPSTNPSAFRFSSLFKPDPFRDFFRVLADSLERSVAVISGDGRRILASNHAFTLLTGFARAELEELPFPTLLPGEAGENAIGEILLAWDNPECKLTDVPLRTRDGTISHIDIDGRTIGPLGSPLLLLCTPSLQRVQQKDIERNREDNYGPLPNFQACFLVTKKVRCSKL